MKSTEHGRGTVRTVRDRKTGTVLGYQALLPRHLSTPPRGVTSKKYQEAIGPVLPTKAEARGLLDAAITKLRDKTTFRHGLPFSEYVAGAIKAKTTEARREHGSDVRANKVTATWRSIDRCWLVDADFYGLPPAVIQAADLQRFIDHLCDEAEGKSGEPLSHPFIRNVAQLIRAALDRHDGPNQARLLDLPEKGKPRIRYLELASLRRFFGAVDDEVPFRDRAMAGCGTGAGLRVGELLALEAIDVHLDDHDPHLVVRYGGPNHAPPKGRLVRRVELFEPGLGFWRLWMRQFYRSGDVRVFSGPEGGYLKAWPERFPGWAKVAGVERMTSHVMRHSYAVAMLSGTWGYEPRSLEFVSKQLGHADTQTTERYYGAFEFGVWQREVRRMTGRDPERPRRPVTASELLGLDASNDACPEPGPVFPRAISSGRLVPRHPPKSPEISADHGRIDATAHQAIAELDAALDAAARLDPHAARLLIDAATTSRAVLAALAFDAEPEAESG